MTAIAEPPAQSADYDEPADEYNFPPLSPWAQSIYEDKYAWKDEDGNVTEVWPDTAYRVTRNILGALGYTDRDPEFQKIFKAIAHRKFIPGGRYLYSAGRPLHQVQNCALYRAEDSREGWRDLVGKAMMALTTGAGIGVDYSDVRPAGSLIKKTGGVATGPVSLARMVNEIAREIISGGNRRSAIWAGLRWDHPDIFELIDNKDWDEDTIRRKADDFRFPAPLDMTNISVQLNNEFFFAYENAQHPKHELAHRVYDHAIDNMLRHAEPGFSIDVGENSGETLRNACTEITSADDSDICNLGSINLARVESKEEFAELVDLGMLFLLAGTVYSDLPHEEIKVTREKNRRLGLGLMGIHEWLLKRGYRYEPNEELSEWLEEYAKSTEIAAEWADAHDLSRPVKTRAIAPNGTIGMVAETTTSGEPIPMVAYKRYVIFAAPNGQTRREYQYVIDPTAERLISEGVDPYGIETAHALGYDIERRIAMQAWLQEYVDHGISSTMNLYAAITDPDEQANFGATLMKYLPKLRGITVYPDGSRPGQPMVPVDYYVARDQTGVVFEAEEETCVGGICGI
jgi:ribonucleoside-diphosphate reductase alpha chain